MTAVMFERRGYEFSIRFPYNATVVSIIKTSVPSYARSWHPHVKAWTVDAEFALPLADILRRSGYTVRGLKTSQRTAHHDRDDEIHWAQLLFKRIGPDRAPAAYRLLSKLCHPDSGGHPRITTGTGRGLRRTVHAKENSVVTTTDKTSATEAVEKGNTIMTDTATAIDGKFRFWDGKSTYWRAGLAARPQSVRSRKAMSVMAV